MPDRNFSTWLEQLQCQALTTFERQLVLLVGDVFWVKTLLQINDKTHKTDGLLVFSHHPCLVSSIDNKHFAQQLGSEHNQILFSCVESPLDGTINLDAFAALSGTLVAGGVMFLWLEQPLEQAIEKTKLLSLKYFYQQLSNNKDLVTVQQRAHQTFPIIENDLMIKPTFPPELLYQSITEEQQVAVEKVINVNQGHRNRPLVLTADRGRGKSSALAIACVQLLENNHAQGNEKLNIVITAPHLLSLSVFYRQISHSFAGVGANVAYENTSKTSITHRFGSIKFIAIDQLIHESDSLHFSLLLVDEAASIPVYLLTELCVRYSRIVFSSTVHGYEGAGRGFTLKFKQKLKQLKPQWRSFHLHEPIRWRNDDPLEAFVFDSCLLNAELAELPALRELSDINNAQASLCFSQLSSEELIRNTALFKQVFSVLVTAHYQTSPNDIALILDNNTAHVFIAKLYGNIVGVALLLEEGGDNNLDIQAVASNQRRLKNQFIPQSLLTHCGFSESFSYHYLRILRIAIHPQYHGCGFGHHFMKYLKVFAKNQQVDFIGASFGANAQLLNFWQNEGCQLARIGFTKDKASGEHSALVVCAISDKAQFFERKIINEFYSSFDYLLTDEYKGLTAQLVWQVLHHCPQKNLPKLTTHQLSSITDFMSKKRQFSHCVRALHYWCLIHCKSGYEPRILLLIERILQKKSVEDVCHNHQLTGKKMLNEALIEYVLQHQSA
ncbi:MAG: GNAT family N-acetyltransferase [Alteromonadaceae bacterium]